jgi:hypothetical protein
MPKSFKMTDDSDIVIALPANYSCVDGEGSEGKKELCVRRPYGFMT